MDDQARIVFVAEGGGPKGFGHVHRLKTLAVHLQDDFVVHFFMLNSWPSELKDQLLHAFGGSVNETYDSVPELIHPKDIVVWDGYNFDDKLVKSCKDKGALQVIWDDFLHYSPMADLIINAAPGMNPMDLSGSFHTRSLAGSRWFPLHPNFRKDYGINRIPESLFICFGGSDPFDYTAQAIYLATQTASWSKIVVVTGPAYQGATDLQVQMEALSKAHRVEWYQAVPGLRMAQLMQECEFALVPSSSVAYEALHSGCKVLAGAMVDNQGLYHSGFVKEQWIIDAGHFREKEIEKAILSRHRPVSPFPGKELADKQEWTKVFRSLYLFSQLKVRKAQASDLQSTYAWASHPEVRNYAFNSRNIAFEEHQSWFLSTIGDLNCLYLILAYRGRDMGSCRFDRLDHKVRISYLLDPETHGQGFGLALLQASIAFLEEEWPFVEEIAGEVLNENIPSLKIFETLGFESHQKGNTWFFRKGKGNFKP
jgi:spore coat polysaccharide biosynthesis predicted glycosyltransferase SpsG/RimJ/RimL family protein N-acetyltransferase